MKKKLIWKLKEQPTAEGVARLVEQGVITKEEARDIVTRDFDSKEKDEAAEAELQFLRKIVERMMEKVGKDTYWPIIFKEYPPFQRYYPYWDYSNNTTSSNYGTVYCSTIRSINNKTDIS